jgi:hypothetical protein
LRVDGLESRSSPALIWTGWDALDPVAYESGSTAEVAQTSDVVSTSLPTTADPTPTAPSTLPGAVPVPVQSVTPSEPGRADTGFTGVTPYSFDEGQYDPQIGPGGDGGGQGQSPVIVNFVCVGTTGGVWTFSGTVLDDTPAGLTVRLGGAPISLQNQTAMTDSGGNFTKSFVLRTDGSDAGTATADTTDLAGNPSNTAECNVHP